MKASELKPEEHTCERCGRRFVLGPGSGWNSHYCSEECAFAAAHPAEPEPRILSERECAERIQKMRAEGRLPSLEEFRAAVDRALATLDEPDKITPERKAALLRLLGEIREAARQRAGDHLPLGTRKIQ